MNEQNHPVLSTRTYRSSQCLKKFFVREVIFRLLLLAVIHGSVLVMNFQPDKLLSDLSVEGEQEVFC